MCGQGGNPIFSAATQDASSFKKKKKRARAVFVWDEGTKNVYVEHMGTESMPSESSAASNKLFILQQTGFSRSKKMVYLKSSAKRDFLSQELI